MLPLRPKPFRDESLFSYLVRLSAVHGFDGPGRLWRALGSPAGSRLVPAIAEAADLFTDVVETLSGPAPPCFRAGTPGRAFTNAWNHRYVRWCPLCVREQAYLRRLWHLKTVTACPQHRCQLVDQCPHCGDRLAIFRLTEMRCACGAALDAACTGAPCVELELALARAAADFHDRGEGAALFETLSHLVVLLGQFNSVKFPQKPGKLVGLDRLDVASELAVSADRLLSSWPTRFEEMLTDRLAHVRANALSAQLPEVFGSLYRVLYKRLAGPEYQFLRDAFEAFLRRHWWGLLCKRNSRLGAETISGHCKVSRREAAKRAGVALSSVKRLVQSEVVPADVFEAPSGRQLTLIDERDLPQISRMANTALTMQEASSRLGLPQRLVKQMIASKLLTLFAGRPKQAGAWMISPDLPRAPLGVVDMPHLPLRFVLRYWHLTDVQRVDILAAALHGPLRAFIGTPDIEQPLGDASINVTALRRWIDSVRAGQAEPSLSVCEAARRLGVKEEVAYELASRRLLHGLRVGRGLRIPVAEADRFAATYVSLASLAKAAGTSARSLLPRLGAAPIAGPLVDGSRQYFFRRSDVEGGTAR